MGGTAAPQPAVARPQELGAYAGRTLRWRVCGRWKRNVRLALPPPARRALRPVPSRRGLRVFGTCTYSERCVALVRRHTRNQHTRNQHARACGGRKTRRVLIGSRAVGRGRRHGLGALRGRGVEGEASRESGNVTWESFVHGGEIDICCLQQRGAGEPQKCLEIFQAKGASARSARSSAVIYEK